MKASERLPLQRLCTLRSLYSISFISRCIGFCAALLIGSVISNGQVTTLQTGAGPTLQTDTQQLTIGPSTPTLDLTGGFATDETPQPGLFPDSFTITLQDLGQSGQTNTFVIATIDLFGATVNPSSPPGITATPGEIVLTPISDPSEVSAYAQKYSYDVRFTPPAQFAGENSVLYFDLFDNQQAPGSIGWFTPAVVAVPEPTSGKLLLLAAALAWGWHRKKSGSKP